MPMTFAEALKKFEDDTDFMSRTDFKGWRDAALHDKLAQISLGAFINHYAKSVPSHLPVKDERVTECMKQITLACFAFGMTIAFEMLRED